MLSWIVAIALFSAFAIFAAVTTYWPDIVAQPPSAAAFLGALAGAGGGLLAIILGALLNAELNRRRDDRLRWQEAEALMKSLATEMGAIATVSRAHATSLRRADIGLTIRMIRLLEPPRAVMVEANADKFGWIPEVPRRHVFHALFAKETLAATIRGLATHSAEAQISAEARANIAEGFDKLASAADGAVNELRQAKVP